MYITPTPPQYIQNIIVYPEYIARGYNSLSIKNQSKPAVRIANVITPDVGDKNEDCTVFIPRLLY